MDVPVIPRSLVRGSLTQHRELAASNRLLASLSEQHQRRFLAGCDHVDLQFADVLYRAGERIDYVYFPLGCLISSITVLDADSKMEFGIVGDEGMLGLPIVLGVDRAAQEALVQGGGAALRMRARALGGHCGRGSTLHRQLHRYAYVVMSQLAQSAACARFHLIEARLARWLLTTRDRAHSNRFRMTHEFLGYMLGVRRVAVSLAAGGLQRRGLIKYSRGILEILDPAALETSSCGCYRRGKELYREVMQTSARRARAPRRS
jgi:CRP-like cAMP-binding protein